MRITQRFGKENTAPDLVELYNGMGMFGHNGTDVAFDGDLKIYCPVGGKVIYLANNYKDGYGAYAKIMFIVDGVACYMYFCHLDSWSDALKSGTVEAGQYIGVMGGSSLGERYHFSRHLHFGIKPVKCDKNNGYKGYVDPENIVDLSLLEEAAQRLTY